MTRKQYDANVLIRPLGAIIILLLLELFFFRAVIGETNKLIGYSGDARLCNLIVEHWFDVFQGKQAVRDMPIFYPIKNTLSYSEALFAFALPYSMFRLAGLDMFYANKVTIIFVHFLGSISLLYLLWRKFRFSIGVSLLSCLLCSYANSYSLKSVHTQLFFFSAVPVLCIFAFNFFDNIERHSAKRIFNGVLFIAWTGIILCTSFYIGFFTLFFLLIMCLVYCCSQYKKNRNVLKELASFVTANSKEVALYILVGIISIAPFLWIYIPSFLLFKGRGWEEISFMLPHWYDYFNASPANIFWGRVLREGIPNILTRPYRAELFVGFPFITFVLHAISIRFVLKRNNHEKNRKGIETTVAILGISVIISCLLILKVYGISLWWFIYHLVPGASGIRAVSRYLFYLTLPLCIITGYFLNFKFSSIDNKNLKNLLFICLFIVLFLDNTIKEGCASRWNKSDMLRIIDNTAIPPDDCKTVLIADDDRKQTDYNSQLDGWMIAKRFHLNTLNGYSGQYPKGWKLFEVKSKDYYLSAISWMLKYNLDHVYVYNIQTKTWTKMPDFSAKLIATYASSLKLQLNQVVQLLEDFHELFPEARDERLREVAVVVSRLQGFMDTIAQLCAKFGKTNDEVVGALKLLKTLFPDKKLSEMGYAEQETVLMQIYHTIPVLEPIKAEVIRLTYFARPRPKDSQIAKTLGDTKGNIRTVRSRAHEDIYRFLYTFELCKTKKAKLDSLLATWSGDLSPTVVGFFVNYQDIAKINEQAGRSEAKIRQDLLRLIRKESNSKAKTLCELLEETPAPSPQKSVDDH
jgi:hypothetical protein